MILSEQTNATILNTLNGVRHNPLSSFPSTFLGRTPQSTSLPFGLLVSLFWPPLSARLGPFCSGLDLLVAPFFRLVPLLFVVLFTWVFLATGASVHRRGRCIGVSLSLVNNTSLVFVLVCLSVDVTGALVLLNSFCFACLLLLLAPPLVCPFVTSPYSGPAQFASLLSCRCCPPPLCLSCASLRVLPGGFRVFLLFLAPRARRPFLVCVLLVLLVRASVTPCCLLSLVVLPVSVLLASPAPRVVSFVLWSTVLVPPSEYLVAAVTALLPCFLAGSVV